MRFSLTISPPFCQIIWKTLKAEAEAKVPKTLPAGPSLVSLREASSQSFQVESGVRSFTPASANCPLLRNITRLEVSRGRESTCPSQRKSSTGPL